MAHDDAMRLIVLRGLEGKREYILKGDRLVVGRSDGAEPAQIAIDAPGVASPHATLSREGDTYRLDPAHGAAVLVNRRPFAGGLLRDGDQVAFGAALFQFWAGGLRGRAPAAYAAEPGATDATGAAREASSAGDLAPPPTAGLQDGSASREAARSRRSTSGALLITIVSIAAAVVVWLLLRRGGGPGGPSQP